MKMIKIKMNKRFWQIGAAAVVVVVIILLVVLVPSSEETPGPTPTPTSMPTATVTGVGYPTATATGIGYSTATPTEVGQLTATYTSVVGPTATSAPGTGCIAAAPPQTSGACDIYFDKASCTVNKGDAFTIRVAVDKVDYLVSGMFDILYDSGVVNLDGIPTDGVIHDPADGDITVDIQEGGIGGNWWDSGRLRLLVDVPWSQTIPGPPEWEGGNGTGTSGDGYLTEFVFKAVGTGTCDIAFWDCATPRQVNQILGWIIYQDYSYDSDIVVWGANLTVTVK